MEEQRLKPKPENTSRNIYKLLKQAPEFTKKVKTSKKYCFPAPKEELGDSKIFNQPHLDPSLLSKVLLARPLVVEECAMKIIQVLETVLNMRKSVRRSTDPSVYDRKIDWTSIIRALRIMDQDEIADRIENSMLEIFKSIEEE